MRKRLKFIPLIGTLVLGATITFGATNTKEEDRKQLSKFNQFFSALSNTYVEDIDAEALTEEAIRAVLKELDPHSVYYDAEEMKGIRENMGGEFSGVGVEFRVMDDTIRVINTIVGGPAEKVGVKANDRIVKIDSQSAIGVTQAEVPKLLRGKTGSRVDIDVVRHGENKTLHFTIIRDKIPINTVDAAYKLTPTTGYIRVNRFGETTMSEFRSAYQGFGGGVENLVVDLRQNSGGLLSQAIEMANFFLPKGAIVVTTEGEKVETQTLKTTREGEFTSGNVIVIIDGSSASASEIVAGAIQDWDRGVVVGKTSFGKGLVQRQYPLLDGSAVRITTSRYHTPSGRVIQRPYTKGEREEYYKRSSDKEVDSLELTPQLKYKTLRLGREVYGGGGINPDIETVRDTTTLSDGYAQFIRRGVVNNYIISVLDRSREELTQKYPTSESFKSNFTISDKMILDLIDMAKTEGIDVEKVDLGTLKSESERYLKALIAQRLYSTSAFYEIINSGDTLTFAPIMRLLENWEEEIKKVWHK